MVQLLRLATYNLENLGDEPAGGPTLDQRIAALRPHFARMDADIVCLQEINAQVDPDGQRHIQALDRLLEGTRYQDYHRVVTRNETGTNIRQIQNLVVLSRFPVVRERQIHHHFVAPPDHRSVTADVATQTPDPVEWDRPFQHVTLDVGGHTLELINLHLRAPLAAFVAGQKISPFVWRSVAGWAEGYYLAAIKSAGQAFEVRLVLDQLFDAKDDALIAVCGDFNAEAREVPLITICGDVEDTGNEALAGRVMVPLEATTAAAGRYTVRHFGRNLMLDHILASREFLGCFRSLEIHNETLSDELVAFASGRHPPDSFHAPVVAAFELA